MRLEQGERFAPGGGLERSVAGRLERSHEEAANVVVVVDDEDQRRARRSFVSTRARGHGYPRPASRPDNGISTPGPSDLSDFARLCPPKRTEIPRKWPDGTGTLAGSMSEAGAPTSSDALIGLETHILDRVDAAVMAMDLAGTIVFANRYVETLYGWSPAELMGQSSSEFSGVAVSPELAREIRAALEANTSWEGTFEVRRKDGSAITIRAIDSPLYDKAGRLAGVVSVGLDGSRDRAVETMLQEQATTATVFRQLGETLLEHHEPEPLLQAVIHIATKAVGAEFGAFFPNPADGSGISGAVHAPSGFPLPENTKLFDQTFRGNGITRVDDITKGTPTDGVVVRAYLAAPVRSRAGDTVGGLFFLHRQRGVFSAADADLLGAIATQAGLAIDNARAHTALEVEIAARRRTQEVEHFLAECAVTLASSLDHQRNLTTLAAMAVPFLADVCLIDVADGDQVRRVAAAHADPNKRALMDELLTNFAPDPQGGHPALRALREGTTSFAGTMTDDFIRANSRDERHYEIVKALGFSSFISVPMTARGRTQGALSLISCSPEHPFDDRDVAIATELANHAAAALDNAWLYDDQQHARAEAEAVAERLRQLQGVSTELSRAVTVTEVATVIRGVSMPDLESPTPRCGCSTKVRTWCGWCLVPGRASSTRPTRCWPSTRRCPFRRWSEPAVRCSSIPWPSAIVRFPACSRPRRRDSPSPYCPCTRNSG